MDEAALDRALTTDAGTASGNARIANAAPSDRSQRPAVHGTSDANARVTLTWAQQMALADARQHNAFRAALAAQGDAPKPDRTPNDDEVICPGCVHQFRAIPVNVQKELARLREIAQGDAVSANARVNGQQLYEAYAGNHPTIHCNRFPSWSELTHESRKQWLNAADTVNAAISRDGAERGK